MGGAWSRMFRKFTKNSDSSKDNSKSMAKVHDKIDDQRRNYILALGKTINISAVGNKTGSANSFELIGYFRKKLESLGTKVRYISVGKNTPILFGDLKASQGCKRKKTLLVYGTLEAEDGSTIWRGETGGLYGSISMDSKITFLSWIHAIGALKEGLRDLPVNIKFILNGMGESNGSLALEEILENMKDTFFVKDIDFICISGNDWLGKEGPCLCHGMRGNVYFELAVTCASKDLHSGLFGGTVNEAMTDLIQLMDTLVDKEGKILIEGIYEEVEPVSSEELESFRQMNFDVDEYKERIGVEHLTSGVDKVNTLMALVRCPSLSIHGIEGAFHENGTKTVIPRSVIGKFSIRIVPGLTADRTAELVERHLRKELSGINSGNKIHVQYKGTDPWVTSSSNPNFRAGTLATQDVYGQDPDLIQDGECLPSVFVLDKIIGKNIMILPMGPLDMKSQKWTEKMNIDNFIEGSKVFASYLYHLGE
uniref:Cytosolic non-specific dipeptidase n=1 Tax=Caligus rogercresseyi TaxID=217165 RepID=C1BQ98_CALRO|nr:Cytosolic non-specific dipeptidase [Caligus rogercresseyi]